MSRLWLRLVAVITMVSYLLASGHASLALHAMTPGKNNASTVASEQAPEQIESGSKDEQKPRSKCKHCQERQAVQEQTPSEQEPEDAIPDCQDNTPCQGSDDPRDESCPCCPKGPGGKPCPVPGGCVYCNMAKVPCVSQVPTAAIEPAPATDEANVDLPVFYLSPTCGSLIRPPKA